MRSDEPMKPLAYYLDGMWQEWVRLLYVEEREFAEFIDLGGEG